MTVSLVAIHYPHAPHYAEFVARVQHAVEVMRPLPGCLAADCWVTATGEAVVSITQWESEEAQAASFGVAKAAGVDFDYDEREARPRQILRLVPPPAAA
jgi:heme-degrading monooxygenase HmoA